MYHGKNTGTHSLSPATAPSHRALKCSTPLAVLSMTTMVAGSFGTVCMTPSSRSSLLLGQKAYSEICTLVSVSDRPTPPLPAVWHRMLLRRPGRRRFSPSSRVGFSNTSSLALLFFRRGRARGGRQS